MTQILTASLLALVLGLIATQALVSPRLRGLALDHPNDRSLHQKVVPRTGGLAILVVTTLSMGVCFRADTLLLWGTALALGIVSFIDDRRGLPVRLRLAAQLIAAVTCVYMLAKAEPIWWLLLACLTVVWMTNLFNFMDGSDGLAGGMGAIGFAAYALAATHRGDAELAFLCACLSAGCLAFLSKNFPPASIFMGDAGSTVLGFSASTVGIYGNARGHWPLWFPALVFLPFIADATATLAARALRREKVWQAHRQHYYQRLIRSGWSHRRMAIAAWSLMLATAATALAFLHLALPWGWAALAGWVLSFGVAMRLVDVRWREHVRSSALRGADA